MEGIKKSNPEKWTVLDDSEKNSEQVSRKSLTFWQDAWRRLRANKVAMIALVVIVIIMLMAIIIPSFWPYTYEDQVLELSNIPNKMEVYELNDELCIYVNNEYKAIEVDKDGTLLGMAKVVKKDDDNKKNIYTVNDKELVVDYSNYFNCKKEYMKLQKKYKNDVENVPADAADYLKKYYAENDSDGDIISLERAEWILENKVERYQVLYDGQKIEKGKTLRNKSYIMGTDSLGRDEFIRVVYGARISLTVGFAAALVNLIIGILYGGVSGYFGGRVDMIMMRIVEVISSVPMMLYVILLMVILEPGLNTIIIALSITYWVGMARIVRGQVLGLKEQEFVLAAKNLGASTFRILTKHLVPNIMGPVMVSLTMQIPDAIFTEAFLSFVGLGVSAPKASWGTLCNDALSGLYTYPYQMFYPALAISITILSFNLLGDGLRDALDPKQRK